MERAIAALAEAQHGVVSRRQLLELGLGAGAIEWRVGLGRLVPLHRGVYTVGHRVLSQRRRWMAAVLAAGREAVLSHHAAATLWHIRQSARHAIDVTAPRSRQRPGLRIHASTLAPDEVTVHHDIPTTTAARTLLDLAGVLQPAQLTRALERAEQLRLADRTPLTALLERHPKRRGTAVLRVTLRRGLAPVRTRSELEADFLTLLEAHGLPPAIINGQVQGHEVDFH